MTGQLIILINMVASCLIGGRITNILSGEIRGSVLHNRPHLAELGILENLQFISHYNTFSFSFPKNHAL